MQLVRNGREKSRLVIGLVAGAVVGAILPDRFNPWVYVAAWFQSKAGK